METSAGQLDASTPYLTPPSPEELLEAIRTLNPSTTLTIDAARQVHEKLSRTRPGSEQQIDAVVRALRTSDVWRQINEA